MSSGTSERFEEIVDEKQREAELVESERKASPAARKAAIARTRTLHQRSGLRRFLFENGLSLAALGFFVFSFVGQVLAGKHEYNADRHDHGQPPVAIGTYLKS